MNEKISAIFRSVGLEKPKPHAGLPTLPTMPCGCLLPSGPGFLALVLASSLPKEAELTMQQSFSPLQLSPPHRYALLAQIRFQRFNPQC